MWILVLLAALTLVGLGVVSMQLDRQVERLRHVEEAQARMTQVGDAQLSTLDAAVRHFNLSIEQQASLLSRIVGTVVPVRIPESTENELLRIESELAETDKIAAAKDETARLAREFTLLIDGLPAVAVAAVDAAFVVHPAHRRFASLDPGRTTPTHRTCALATGRAATHAS